MKIDKSIPCSVHIYKNRCYLADMFDSFDSVNEIKRAIKMKFPSFGKLQVNIRQEGGYFKSFFIKA